MAVPMLQAVDRAALAAGEGSGFAILRAVWSPADCDAAGAELDAALDASQAPGVLRSGGRVYGARNLEAHWPRLLSRVRHSRLARALQALLGPDACLVRAILFDKPPGRGWGVDWHRDQSIAVAALPPAGDLPPGYERPTHKSGVAHLDAPPALLDRMWIARLHLDPADAANGALQVRPGSHLGGAGETEIRIDSEPGDVLFMRPRLLHASDKPQAGDRRRRRVLHLECAPRAILPAPLSWALAAPIVDHPRPSA